MIDRIRISAFADEIDADPRVQARVLRQENIRWVELRGAWGINVLDLSDAQVGELGSIFAAAGVRVSGIASPIGKTAIDRPAVEEFERMERALRVAARLEATEVRVFSFYGPSGGDDSWRERYRPDVVARLRRMTALATEAGVTLQHENERGIYGDTVERCVDLLESVDSPHFRAVFDPANFIACGQLPYPLGYERLRSWISHLHVKDATADGTVTVAGEGITDFRALLERMRADGFRGVLALEPHLATQGRFSGFSGPALFHDAVSALTHILDELEWARD